MTTPVSINRLAEFDAGEAAADGVVYTGRLDPVFTIGPKVHGGSMQLMVAAAARQALSKLADPDEEIAVIAISSDYLAAPDPAAVQLHAWLIKTGRTVSVVRVDARQNDRLLVTSTVTLGRPDHGDARYRGEIAPLADLPVEAPDDYPDISSSPLSEVFNVSAAVDVVLDLERFPAIRGETGEPLVRGWVRPRSDVSVDVHALFPILVGDISPPVVMNLGFFGWSPTVQLTTYVNRVPAPGWLRFAATSQEVGQGMFAEDHIVVDSLGTTVAQSRQLALLPAAR
ncbi:thioesterase family protein [Gordonia hydrophobica]|uniref:Thioesterase family protein n=1 Tax=Gordonia hydrophobica TaxID=40516 RepID=A0ABZ2TVY6_9ACTN|nr:thioesterase family protein [Gordonia hydrophobica]MBM7365990.1 acyl-CoA thioesterase [Gordonia hydrophobica]